MEAAKRNARGPILVICPRLSKLWWKKIIEDQDAGYALICKASGRGIPFRVIAEWAYKRPSLWIIVHPEAVRLQPMLRLVKWDWIICDEAHRFKNRKAKQTKALWRIRARRKVCLTATPYGRSPADMWALLHWLDPRYYSSYWRFTGKYVESHDIPGQRWRKIIGGKNLKELAEELAPIYKKRMKSDVLDLPPLTYKDVPVPIEGRQAELYKELKRDAYAEFANQEIVIENGLTSMLRLHQCALDPGLLIKEEDAFPEGIIPAKVQWLQAWLEDNPNEPVVLTSRYRRFVETWLRELAPQACIVGGMKQEEVQAALKVFEETGRLVGSLDAIAESLNLQRASTLIVLGGTWSPVKSYQLAQRIHRIGTTRPCQVITLVGEVISKSGRSSKTVDHLIQETQKSRRSMAEMVDMFVKQIQAEGGK